MWHDISSIAGLSFPQANGSTRLVEHSTVTWDSLAHIDLPTAKLQRLLGYRGAVGLPKTQALQCHLECCWRCLLQLLYPSVRVHPSTMVLQRVVQALMPCVAHMAGLEAAACCPDILSGIMSIGGTK